MNRNQNNFEKIEDYLNQRLNDTERADFEREIKADPELTREVELHRSLQRELHDTDALAFRKKLVSIGEILNEKQPKSSLFSWKIAAGIIVLVSLSAYLLLRPASNEDLFDTYYKAYPVEDLIRGESATDNDEVYQGYANGDYRGVVAELQRLSNEDPTNEVLKLYLGNSYLNLDLEEKAVSVFQEIKVQSKYYEDAQWYMALANIKQKKFKMAVASLTWLVKYDGLHKKNAAALLHRIKIENPDDF